MVGIPQERFEENVSLVFIPDSKENQIKTSDGKLVVPHELVIEMLKRVCAYDPEHSIAQSYYCVCRIARDCKDYPRSIGCMIVGPGAVDMVERKMGRLLTLEEAINFIEKEVMPKRLSSFISVFPGDLRYFWGVKPHHSKYSFEICFCCPCCCVLKKPHFFIPNEPIDGNEPFIDIRGFRAVRDYNKCEGCGTCIEYCPLNRIKLIDVINKDGKLEKKAINENCIGCGNCVPYCPNGAIEMVATENFDKLEDLLGIFEYFDIKKEEFLKKLNEKYQQLNKKL
ncbi:MAG: 4Fe-4S binding protein [Promethearchaeia archaeon]